MTMTATLTKAPCAVKETPILFSAPMIRALLDGSKTQTRRVVKPQPHPGIYSFIDLGVYGGRSGEGPWKPSWGSDDLSFKFPSADETSQHNACLTCPYGTPGNRLWVREQMRVIGRRSKGGQWTGVKVRYEADGAETDWIEYPPRLRWEIEFYQCLPRGGHREASRLTLEIVSVRVERLQSITEADARAEGVAARWLDTNGEDVNWGAPPRYRQGFAALWRELNDKRPGCGWDSNPWVWVLSFRRAAP